MTIKKKKERKPNALRDAHFRLFALRLIGGKWCYSVVSHIVQNAADVCRDIDRGFFRLPNERMFQQLVIFRSLSFFLDQTEKRI